MPTITVPETDLTVSQAVWDGALTLDQMCPTRTVSPSRNYGNGNRWIEVQLTSSEWDAKAGTGVLCWGVEYRDNAGNWQLAIGGADDLGVRGRDGLLPRVRITADWLVQFAPVRLRLFAWSTVALRAGAVVTTGV